LYKMSAKAFRFFGDIRRDGLDRNVKLTMKFLDHRLFVGHINSLSKILNKSAGLLSVKVELRLSEFTSSLHRNLNLSLFSFARCGRAGQPF